MGVASAHASKHENSRAYVTANRRPAVRLGPAPRALANPNEGSPHLFGLVLSCSLGSPWGSSTHDSGLDIDSEIAWNSTSFPSSLSPSVEEASMLVAVAEGPPTEFDVRPWPDSVIDEVGHDPRSAYVERFWLGVLGPSSVVFLRRLARELESSPSGFTLPLEETARTLGLGMRGGRNSPFLRTITRCAQFHLVHFDERGATMLGASQAAAVDPRPGRRSCPSPCKPQHEDWQANPALADARQRIRGRRLALSLFELGEGVEAAESQLLRWRFPPAVARDATAWAWRRHAEARAAAEGSPTGTDPPA